MIIASEPRLTRQRGHAAETERDRHVGSLPGEPPVVRRHHECRGPLTGRAQVPRFAWRLSNLVVVCVFFPLAAAAMLLWSTPAEAQISTWMASSVCSAGDFYNYGSRQYSGDNPCNATGSLVVGIASNVIGTANASAQISLSATALSMLAVLSGRTDATLDCSHTSSGDCAGASDGLNAASGSRFYFRTTVPLFYTVSGSLNAEDSCGTNFHEADFRVDSGVNVFAITTFQNSSVSQSGILQPGEYAVTAEADTMAAGSVRGVSLECADAAFNITFQAQTSPFTPVVDQFLGPPGTSTNPTGAVAEPVNTATGNYYSSHRDLFVRGRGLNFSFTRYYNSLDPYNGPLGVGWTHSYNVTLAENPGSGVVTIKRESGESVAFTPTGPGTYGPLTTGLFDTLLKRGDGSFTLIQKNRTQLDFSPAGRFLTIGDRNGNTQALAYDGIGNLASVTDSAGRSLFFSYDQNRRLVALTDPIGRVVRYAYDIAGNLVSYQDASGGVWYYAYDGSHRMISATDPRGVVYLRNTYDSQGRVVAQANGRGFVTSLAYGSPTVGITAISDPVGNTTQHVYDAQLRLVQVIDAQGGGSRSFVYDGNNNRTSATDQNGRTTTSAYNSRGNLISITNALGSTVAFTYDGADNLLTATNATGQTTTFSYDTNGNLTAIQDALGGRRSYTYGGVGNLLSSTDSIGHTSTFQYDSSGNVIQAMNALGSATRFAYDGISRLVSVTDANSQTTRLAYDALSRQVRVTSPIGSQTQYTYDPLGNLVALTDANGNITYYEYDGTSNLVRVTDALGGVTRYGYDGNSNRISFTDANGHTTAYAYDSLNRQVQMTDPLLFATTYSYDPAGNVVAVTDANNGTHRFAYDALNRLVAASFSDGNQISYTYDANGRRTKLVDSHGTTTYAYDALDRLIAVTDVAGKMVQYGYDTSGHRTLVTYPDGRVVNYRYDRGNRLSQVTDWEGLTSTYEYDPAGNLISVANPNGTVAEYAHDAASRLVGITNKTRDKTLFSQYILDKVGNRLQVISSSNGANLFGYDGLHRLVSWTAPSGDVAQYVYDPAGNRIAMVTSQGSVRYTYDVDNRLMQAGQTAFTYDNNGNLTSKTADGASVQYAFDALNRLVSVDHGQVRTLYQYDGDGNRVAQQAGASVYQYVNDVATSVPRVLSENGSDGAFEYVYGVSLISSNSLAFRYFYQFDEVGSVVNVTNRAGAVNANYAYDPWGNAIAPGPPKVDAVHEKNKFRFTGEAFDPGTELYYLRARYYDPSVGRFISKDPFAGLARSSLTTNRYIYARDNPVRFVDPTGFAAEPGGADAPGFDPDRDLRCIPRAYSDVTFIESYKILWNRYIYYVNHEHHKDRPTWDFFSPVVQPVIYFFTQDPDELYCPELRAVAGVRG